ncbi:MAG: selenocysteine-specific translation elongation factor [Candidatus Hydrogenedentota bacterium]
MNYMTLGVIGHVDHGKTSLVKALTGMETDRLKEEKERGISIALGYAWADLPEGRIGVVDVPGHEKFIRTMVSGATGIRAVLLVLDVNEGVKPQTIEHLNIAELLGIDRGIIAITKCDTADDDMRELAALDIRDYLEGSFLSDAPLLYTSAHNGEGLDEIRAELGKIVEELGSIPGEGAPYLPVDRAFSMAGFGQVVTGTLRRGAINVGDELVSYPGGNSVKVRELQSHGDTCETVEPGKRCAVNVRLEKRVQLNRGDVLAPADSVQTGTAVLCAVDVLAEADRALKQRQEIRALWGTTEAIGRVHLLEGDEIARGASAFAQILFDEPVCGVFREGFILRSCSPVTTIGGGPILSIATQRLKRNDAALLDDLALLRDGNDQEVIAFALKHSANGVLDKKQTGYRYGISGADLDAVWSKIDAVDFDAQTVTHRLHLDHLLDTLSKVLEGHHAANPTLWGLSHDQIVEAVQSQFASALIEHALQAGIAEKRLAQTSGLYHLATFTVEGALSDAEQALVREIEDAFQSGGLQPPGMVEVLKNDKERIRLYRYLITEKRLIATSVANKGKSVSNTIVFHADAINQAQFLLMEHLDTQQGFTPSTIKEILGISRKYLIPLLECMDKMGVTKRRGDERVLR